MEPCTQFNLTLGHAVATGSHDLVCSQADYSSIGAVCTRLHTIHMNCVTGSPQFCWLQPIRWPRPHCEGPGVGDGNPPWIRSVISQASDTCCCASGTEDQTIDLLTTPCIECDVKPGQPGRGKDNRVYQASGRNLQKRKAGACRLCTSRRAACLPVQRNPGNVVYCDCAQQDIQGH